MELPKDKVNVLAVELPPGAKMWRDFDSIEDFEDYVVGDRLDVLTNSKKFIYVKGYLAIHPLHPNWNKIVKLLEF